MPSFPTNAAEALYRRRTLPGLKKMRRQSVSQFEGCTSFRGETAQVQATVGAARHHRTGNAMAAGTQSERISGSAVAARPSTEAGCATPDLQMLRRECASVERLRKQLRPHCASGQPAAARGVMQSAYKYSAMSGRTAPVHIGVFICCLADRSLCALAAMLAVPLMRWASVLVARTPRRIRWATSPAVYWGLL